MNKPENIIIHHTAISREKNSNQFDAVKSYHIGKGWGDIGYHWFIEPDGKIKQGRAENKAGAHCSQKSMNYKSIGICLTGNFDTENPTEAQMHELRKLIIELQAIYDIPDSKIYGHRHFATNKTCPGKFFTDEMIQSLTLENMDAEQKKATEAVISVLSALWSKLDQDGQKIASETASKFRELLANG